MKFTDDFIRKLVATPSVKCNSPRKIYNKYLHMNLYVPCRHCSTCLSIQSSVLHQRVDTECSQHKYSIFFTLTYDNEHLPYFIAQSADLNDNVHFVSNRPLNDTFKLEEFDFKISSDELRKLNPVRFYYNRKFAFGTVCKLDIRNFLKRLRINILRDIFHNNKYNYSSYGKIRYFITSEYGPNTYRPHYHGIIWTDNREVAVALTQGLSFTEAKCSSCYPSTNLIFKSWKMCSPDKIDASVVTGDASSYVASYVNGNTELPKILLSKPTCTFRVASKNPIIGCFSSNENEVSFCLCNGTNDLSQFEPGIFPDDKLPLQIFRKYFGFPKRCYQLSCKDLLCLYEKYELVHRFNKTADYSPTDRGMSFREYCFSNAFNYNDYLFAKKVSSWCSSSHTYTFINSLTHDVSTFSAKYDYRFVIPMIFSLIRAFASYSNTLFYSKLQYSDVFDCAWLWNYPNLLIDLPLYVDDFDEFFDVSGLSDVEFSYLYNETSNHKYELDSTFISELLSYNHSSFASKHALRIKHSLSTKIFNDKDFPIL